MDDSEVYFHVSCIGGVNCKFVFFGSEPFFFFAGSFATSSPGILGIFD